MNALLLAAMLGDAGQLVQDEFLEHAGKGALGDAEHGVLDQQSGAAIAGRIVKIRKATGREAADDARVVHLPLPVIAFAHDGVAKCVCNPRFGAARALVVVTRVLLQDRRQNRATDEGTSKDVRVGRAETLAISFHALAISGEVVRSLLEASKKCCTSNRDRIDR